MKMLDDSMKTLDEVRAILDGMEDDEVALILDDIVHDICSSMASDVNNNGIGTQIKFIKEHLGGEGSARNWLLQNRADEIGN